MRFWKFLLPLLASTLCFAAQSDRIPGPIDSSQRVTLSGRIHYKALPQYDQGRVEPTFALDYVTMLFAPSASQSKALDVLLAGQQNPSSPNYHQWLTPEQFGARFGLAANDMQKVTAWLRSQGLRIVTVARGGQFVVFGGTAAQVENAFQMEIHRYNVDGESHFANATLPSIPAALSGIAVGFRGLNDFALKPALRPHPDYTGAGSIPHALAPGDVATIYDINPLYNLSPAIDGTGQKMVLVGQTDIYIDDINNFRTDFGLSSVSSCNAPPSCNTTNLQYIQATAAPGFNAGDLSESDLDLEWSGAVARNAKLIFVTSNFASGGVIFSVQYAIDNNLAPVISMSYGQCEFESAGPPSLATQDLLYQQAATQGISFFAASGDDGPAICDINDAASEVKSALLGLAVDYPASSWYVTGVGGTEFNEGSGTYWNTTNNPTNGGSAISYIPEKSWNDFPHLGFLDGGGGGPSNCFNQNSTFTTCVSGNSKPLWQTGPGVPADGVRDVPDVSLSASNVNDPYIVCTPLSEVGQTGSTSTCANGIETALEVDFSAFGGTSASTPLMAGIAVLLNQYLGTSGLGNINPMLYSLAVSSPTAFHDTPVGSTSVVNCTVGDPVGQPAAIVCPAAGTFGFDTTAGYDLVTGLGSVDANNLAVAWAATRAATTTSISASSTTVNQGTSVTFTATVSPATATGTVSFYNNGSATALGTSPLSSGTATFATAALPPGSDSVIATYSGDGGDATSTSAPPAVVTVTAPFALSASPSTFSVSAGQTAMSTITITPATGFTGSVTFTNSTASNPGSCTSGLPAGALCSFSQGSVPLNGSTPSTVTLTITTAANMTVPSGAQTITVTGTSGTTIITANVSLTVTTTTETFSLSTTAATFPATVGGKASVAVSVNSTTGFIVGTGASATTALPLTYTCSGSPSLATAEISCLISPSGSTNATGVTVTLQTTAPTTQLRPLRGSRIFYTLLLPGLFGVVFVGGSRLRGMRLLSLIVVLGFSTLWLGSCGGGGGTNTSPANPGTPAGSYTVTISATSGGANPVTNSNSPFTFSLVVGN